MESIGVVPRAGAVHILYGSESGLQAALPDDQFIHQNSPNVRDIAEADDGFSFSLSAGDFNSDGFADLAIGVPFEAINSISDAGAVAVLYGTSTGLQASSPDDQFWNQASAGVQGDPEYPDQFAYSLAS